MIDIQQQFEGKVRELTPEEKEAAKKQYGSCRFWVRIHDDGRMTEENVEWNADADSLKHDTTIIAVGWLPDFWE